MQAMISETHFETYWKLFKGKYSNYKSYCEYFENTYINSIFNKWHYYDVKPNIFLTNNACESLNALIKRDWTNRERKPLHIFFNILKEGILELAKENKPWKVQVEITTELKLKATELAEKNIFVKKDNYYFLDKAEKEKAEKTKIERFANITYSNIDDFKSDFEDLIILSWDQSKKLAICYCSQGFKFGICHHKYALEIYQGTRARLVKLAPTKKRGRKRKTATALVHQHEEGEHRPPGKKVKKNYTSKKIILKLNNIYERNEGVNRKNCK